MSLRCGAYLSVLVFISSWLCHAQASTCQHLLISSKVDLIAQVDAFSSEARESLRQLALLRIRIDTRKTQKSDPIFTRLEADFLQKQADLKQMLSKNHIVEDELFADLLADEIVRVQQLEEEDRLSVNEQQSDQRLTIQKFDIDGTKMIFQNIEAGSFLMGLAGKEKPVTLTQSFAILATPTTQFMWNRVVELAEVRFPGLFKFNPRPSQYSGARYPITGVSFEDVSNWIVALNTLSDKGETSLVELIPGHVAGDRYRLPTEAEWEFVVRGRGVHQADYGYADEQMIDEYSWHRDNSNNRLQEVAERRALVIEGLMIYDMLGNVREWVEDHMNSELPGGVDPIGAPNNSGTHVIRGGSYQRHYRWLQAYVRDELNPEARVGDVGFRLVKVTRPLEVNP